MNISLNLIVSCLLVFFVVGIQVSACNFEEWKDWAKKRLFAMKAKYSDPCSALAGVQQRSELHNIPSIKLFMFQNDELDLLADWLQYHSYLFGISNIHIVDNGSQNSLICKLLALYQSCGLHLRRHHGAFSLKHRTMTEVMREYRTNDTFLVPIDADEFITLGHFQNKTIVNYTYSRNDILPAFAKLPVDGRKYKFNDSKYIVFDKEVCDASIAQGDIPDPRYRRVMHGGYAYHTRYKPYEYKTFYFSKGFLATDQGNHFGFVAHDEGHYHNNPMVVDNLEHFFMHSDLVLFHFAASSYYVLKKKVLRAAHSYNYTDDTDCSQAHSGWHYCEPAKAFRANNKQAHLHYLKDCAYPEVDNGNDSLRIDSFTQWFKDHALSTEELLGEPTHLHHNQH